MSTPIPDRKLRVGIFFGGKSAEHEVSLQSAKNVLEALDPQKFEPVLIGISKSGTWHIKDMPRQLEDGSLSELSADSNGSALTLLPGKGELAYADTGKLAKTIDVAFPILHGPFGEDGSMQGLLEFANIPYVGPGVLGSAVGMDKDIMKRLLRDANIPTAPFKVFTFANKHAIDADAIFKEFGAPVFVKPANMGSSVGVRKSSTPQELDGAVDIAFSYDTKIVIEKAIIGDEVECAILGNEHPEASIIGCIIPSEGGFYSYEAKYIDEKGAILEIPAKIPQEASAQARRIAIKTFQVLNCEGMGRVDMFVAKNGEVIVNEINTIPGFTKISMYPKLWEASGVPYTALISRLIDLAIERHERRSQLKTSSDNSL